MPWGLEPPPRGCPPSRLLAGDELGLMKVVQTAGGDSARFEVVARWGEPACSERIIALSTSASTGVVAVGRALGAVELRDCSTGEVSQSWAPSGEGSLTGVHYLEEGHFAGAPAVLSCTDKGAVSVHPAAGGPVLQWSVSGAVDCSAVDPACGRLAVGGKGSDVTVWGLEQQQQEWAARNNKPDKLGLQKPPYVTALAFLDDKRLVTGNAHYELRFYDVGGQRRPTQTTVYGETAVKALAASRDGQVVFAGNGRGDVAAFDSRIGQLAGAFEACGTGAVRSLALHPTANLLASVGLDRFLRVHDSRTRKLLSKLFLKQPLTAVTFDTAEQAQAQPRAEPAAEPEEEGRQEEGAVPADNEEEEARGNGLLEEGDDEVGVWRAARRKKKPRPDKEAARGKRQASQLQEDRDGGEAPARSGGRPKKVKKKKQDNAG